MFGISQIIGAHFAGWLRDLTGSFLWPSVIAAIVNFVAVLLV